MDPIVRQIISLIVVALFSWFYYYLDKLEKIGCKCALNNTRTLLMVSIGLIVVLRLVDAFIPLPSLPQLILSASSVAFVVLAFVYIKHLKTEKCKCSETSTRKIMEIYIWTVVIVWVLALILLLAIMFHVASAAALSTPPSIKRGSSLRTRK